MKKKVLLGVLAVFLIVALVSCDEASWDKIGGLMGDMGNNVYGIKPSMEDVAAVTSTIDNSVKTEKTEDGDDKIFIDLDGASEIIQKLSEIGTSTQKLSQAKEDLKKELKVEGKTSTEIQTALQESLDNVINNKLPSTDSITNEQVKNAVEDVKTALNTIKDKIPENPTQADLATVVIINSLATQVAELKEVDVHDSDALIPLVDTALAALDALKVTTEVSDIDVLGEFNITSLLTSSSESEESKDTSKEDYMKYVGQLEQSIVKLVSQFAKKDPSGVYEFNKVKYQRFLLQMSAIRASYEIASYALMPTIGSDFLSGDNLTKLAGDEKVNVFEGQLEEINSLKNKGDFDSNDLVLYVLSVAATEMDKRAKDFLNTDNAEAIFEKFLEDNAENLKKSPIENLDCSAFVNAYNGKEEIDVDLDSTLSDVCALARTAFVVSLESGLDNLISMFAGENATLEEIVSEQIQKLVHLL